MSNNSKKITPGQFLRAAQPLNAGEGGLVAASPKEPSNVYNLFSGVGTSLLRRQTPRQTPTQFRMPA